MTAKTAQWARVLDAAAADLRALSLADLHEKLGRHLADPSGTIRPEYDGGHRYRATDEHFRGLSVITRVARPDFPQSRRHLASMSPERRAMLEAEWDVPVSDGRRTGPEAF